jgi:Cellulase (glycosyl hydrolase family 5)
MDAKELITGNRPKSVSNIRYRDLRGFNYQPSYGSNGFELWQKFDLKTINKELTEGKHFFPQMNAVRLWLSWDSFIRRPDLFEQRFESALQGASTHGLAVMPVLFNRWHDYVLDYGGTYVEQLLLGNDRRAELFLPYLKSVVGKHAEDERIFAWDICNEPMLTRLSSSWTPSLRDVEYSWLKSIYTSCKELGAKAPLCVGTVPNLEDVKFVEPISDIIATHPYWHGEAKPAYEQSLDDYVEFANSVGKPLLASETCWGSLDDAQRVSIIRYTLRELKKRDIGWLAYLLHHSLIADAHRPEFGPTGKPGNLSFIEANGSLRPGHGVFNDF